MHGERVSFRHVWDLKLQGEMTHFKVIRDSKVLHLEAIVKNNRAPYTLRRQYDKKPHYYIYGGLVFSPLTKNYLMSWGKDWLKEIPSYLKYLHFSSRDDSRFSGKKDIVVLIDILSHPVNSGLSDQKRGVLHSVNDIEIHSLSHLQEVLSSINTEYAVFKFFNSLDDLILNSAKVKKFQMKILKEYGIRPQFRLED